MTYINECSVKYNIYLSISEQNGGNHIIRMLFYRLCCTFEVPMSNNTTFFILPVLGTFSSASFHYSGSHDNNKCLLFPNHSPEISTSLWQRTYQLTQQKHPIVNDKYLYTVDIVMVLMDTSNLIVSTLYRITVYLSHSGGERKQTIHILAQCFNVQCSNFLQCALGIQNNRYIPHIIYINNFNYFYMNKVLLTSQ